MTTRTQMIAVSDDMQASDPANGTEWFSPGSWVTICTADPIFHGKIISITPTHYFLSEASWVVDTGRRSTYSLDPHTANEVEYIGHIAIERPAVSIERVLKPEPLATK